MYTCIYAYTFSCLVKKYVRARAFVSKIHALFRHGCEWIHTRKTWHINTKWLLTFKCPSSAAWCSGVLPSSPRTLGLAPWDSKSSTKSVCPPREALCSAVQYVSWSCVCVCVFVFVMCKNSNVFGTFCVALQQIRNQGSCCSFLQPS